MKKINKFAKVKSTCFFAELISTQVDFTFAINFNNTKNKTLLHYINSWFIMFF